MGKVKDLTGQRFGNLIVLKDTHRVNKYGKEIWLCQCDCENITEKASIYLRKTLNPYCGKCKLAKKRSHKFKDLTGQKFNMLTVIKVDRFTPHGTYWLCKCDCGELDSVRTDMLTLNKIKSCGCVHYSEGFKNKLKIKNTKIYIAWNSMKDRCYNPNSTYFKRYGGRGIKVCDEWLDKKKGFINFYNWAYSHNFVDTKNRAECTLDRIDVNGNYEPNNCRWVSNKTQANNRTSNYYLEYKEEVHTLQEWSERLPINISASVLRERLKRGWTIEKAFTTPVNRNCNRWKNKDEKRNDIAK